MPARSSLASMHAPASKRAWPFFLFSLLSAIAWYLILFRHPGAWLIVVIEEVLLSLCVFQYGSRIFFPASAVRRTLKLSQAWKSRARLLARAFFILGAIAIFSAAVLGLVFEVRGANALQIVGGTLAYFIPHCLFDLIGEDGMSFYQHSSPDPHLILAGSEPLYSSHWNNQQPLR